MFRVLYVCTGNRCRSPFATASLTQLAEHLPVQVESAGTAELGPVPPTTDALRVGQSMGIDLRGHAARTLARVDASEFDLVIGFERNHLAAAVVDGGAAYERAFLLPELARLLRGIPSDVAGDPIERAHALVERAHIARGTDFVPGEEVDDPIGLPIRKYEEVFSQIHDLNATVVGVLFAGAAASGPAESAPETASPQRASAPATVGPASLWGAEEAAAVQETSPPEAEVEELQAEAEELQAAAEAQVLQEDESDEEPGSHPSPVPEATST